MNAPQTRAGQWLLDRSQWDDGQRAFRVRINATAGPDDMHRHILAIEAEARNTLDEKRLARALDVAFRRYHNCRRKTCDMHDAMAREFLPYLVKAYREDTDATPSVRESLERLGLPQSKGRIPPEIVHPAPFEEDTDATD